METETTDSGSLDGPPDGIRCPNCGCPHSEVRNVIKSESSFWGKKKQYVKRYRVCRHCKLPYQTREVVVPEDVPEQIRSPAEAEHLRKIIRDVADNIIDDIPKNPFI